jgi:GDP-4-dehydro-6-deoxy-D-mannose reductase
VRALITGAGGFAGVWLVRECAAAGDEVYALSRDGRSDAESARSEAVDLRDSDEVRLAVATARPEVVYHLAALSSVGRSWEEPARTVGENLSTAANVLEAVRREAPAARVVWVSSCEVYGSPARLPVPESAPATPQNPYAVSKLAGEQLTSVYVEAYGLVVVVARPFSHSGPGQRAIFLHSSLARQAAEARLAGDAAVHVVTGNPDTRRDFTDVRDVVRAYRLLATAPRVEPGTVFNVSSGVSVSTGEQVQLLAELIAPTIVEHEVDPARVRAHEIMDLRGDHTRLTHATGWEPEIRLRETMSETLAWWQRELTPPP